MTSTTETAKHMQVIASLKFDEWPHMPIRALTPGRWQDGLPMTRAVSPVRRERVFGFYGVPVEWRKMYAIDHLVPVALGGTNAVENLWPIVACGPWSHRQKTQVDRAVTRAVRDGRLPIDDARSQLAANWRRAFAQWVQNGGRA